MNFAGRVGKFSWLKKLNKSVVILGITIHRFKTFQMKNVKQIIASNQKKPKVEILHHGILFNVVNIYEMSSMG